MIKGASYCPFYSVVFLRKYFILGRWILYFKPEGNILNMVRLSEDI